MAKLQTQASIGVKDRRTFGQSAEIQSSLAGLRLSCAANGTTQPADGEGHSNASLRWYTWGSPGIWPQIDGTRAPARQYNAQYARVESCAGEASSATGAITLYQMHYARPMHAGLCPT